MRAATGPGLGVAVHRHGTTGTEHLLAAGAYHRRTGGVRFSRLNPSVAMFQAALAHVLDREHGSQERHGIAWQTHLRVVDVIGGNESLVERCPR
jgi:hypothetical protein